MKLKTSLKHFIATLLLITTLHTNAQTREEFGDWTLHCETTPSNNCVMSQVAKWQDTGETLSQFNVFLNKQKKAEFILPLGIKLDVAPKLYIANKLITKLQVMHCLNNGCYFKYSLNQAKLEQFLKMHSGHIEITSGNGEKLKIPISGSGSRAAHNRFKERFNTQ